MQSSDLGASKLTAETVLVVVANYEFNDNARNLKRYFAPDFPAILIDSSSAQPPEEADLIVRNEGYRGLWNAAVKSALERRSEWLFFIASDVQLRHCDLLTELMLDVVGDPAIALWTPSISADSRHSFRTCTHRPGSIRRLCGAAEGFCFLVRLAAIQEQYPIPESNRFGYSIDMASAIKARSFGAAIVDDRVVVFHPVKRADHLIDEQLADELGKEYLGSVGLDQDLHRAVDLMEYYAKQGFSTPEYGARKSLHLGCGNRILDPFQTGDAWGVDLIARSGSDRILAADLIVDPIPSADRQYDYVCAFHFIEHIPRLMHLPQLRFPLIALMNEIHRVLRPGGLFLCLSAGGSGLQDGVAIESPVHGHGITEQTFPSCFCLPELSAAAYGFTGRFRLEQQHFQSDGQLFTLLRSV